MKHELTLLWRELRHDINQLPERIDRWSFVMSKEYERRVSDLELAAYEMTKAAPDEYRGVVRHLRAYLYAVLEDRTADFDGWLENARVDVAIGLL